MAVRTWAVVLALVVLVGSAGLALVLALVPRSGDHSSGPAATRETHTVHVTTVGDDAGPGTESQPMRTLGAAVRESGPGDTIVVHEGTYREELEIADRPGLRIVAAPGSKVWLDGSVVVAGWLPEGGRWVAGGWRTEFDDSPTYSWGEPDNKQPGWSFVSPEHPMAANPDQVWIDGERQVQVGARGEVGAGTFYVDYDSDEIVLGSDPTGRTVTASALTRALQIRSAGVLLRGIGIRGYAPSVPHMGAVTVEAPDVTLERVTVSDNATTGMHVMSDGVTLRDTALERNGMMGLSATEAGGLELVRVTVRDNNLEQFNRSPSAGGAKIGRSDGVLVRDSVFADNLGNGLWFDESAYDIRLLHSKILDNAGHGVSIEVSGKAAIVGNVVARNGENGLKLNDVEDVQVWNNTFVDNTRSINVVQDDRDLNPGGSYRDPDLPLRWQTQSVAIRNNVLVHTGEATEGQELSRTCLLCVEDFSGRWTAAEMDVTALGNVYQRPDTASPRWMIVWSRRDKDPFVFRSVDQFRATVQQEESGAEFTGTRALTPELGPEPALERLYDSVAQPLPDDLAELAGRPVGDQHLGAWIS
jgi:hypothetical protein